jgi:acyl carrier protein
MLHNHEQHLLDYVQTRLIRDRTVPINRQTMLFEEGWINSINILDLIGFLEKRLGRRLDDREIIMENFRSVHSIATTFFNA